MKSFKDLRTEAVKSADKKPETYTGPDGKAKVRMVPVDKNVTNEKTLTPAEKKKREEIAKAIEKDNPDMPMDKKMAIATATAKRVAEASDSDYHKTLGPTKNSDEGIAALKKKHGMTHDQAKATIKRLMGEEKIDEISVDKMLDYKQRAKYSRDRASNSQAAHSLRGTDPSKDQDTERKRNRGLKTFDKLAARKTRAMLTKKESVNLEEATDDKMKKVKQLAQLGLVDKSQVTMLLKALTDMNDGKTLNVRQKDILIGTLNDLIGIVTGDTTTFMKAKKAVKEDIQVDEISQKKITNYIGAASDSTKQKTAAMADKRASGVNLALKKATGKAKVNATENKDK